MPREMPIAPHDLMELDRALALVVLHDQQGRPWLIGHEATVLDRAKRTVRYYADRTLWKETGGKVADPEYNGGDTPVI